MNKLLPILLVVVLSGCGTEEKKKKYEFIIPPEFQEKKFI